MTDSEINSLLIAIEKVDRRKGCKNLHLEKRTYFIHIRKLMTELIKHQVCK